MIIHVDFRARQVINEATARVLDLEVETITPEAHWQHMVNCTIARYGDNQPKHGVVYEQPLRGPIFDTYGHGNVHDSIHQARTRIFNRPCPFQANLPKIVKYLEKNKGRVLRLGSKSDPFMWMDHKYKITKAVLEYANQNNITLIIDTMSDLCAHDDYVELLKGHTVRMMMGFKQYQTDEIEKKLSPGAPSLKRRQVAIDKLRAAGIEVEIVYNTDLKLLAKAKKDLGL